MTNRQEEVLARQDKEATVYAARARSAQNLQKAAEALQAGRKEEAKGYIQMNQALFSETAAVAGSAAVAQDVADQKAAYDEYDQASSGEDTSRAVKRTKAKALKDFGRLGSTY